MAEALFNFESSKKNYYSEARSAGVSPHTHIIQDTVETMHELGLDISDHRPKPLSSDMVNWADKIILLDGSIKDRIMDLPLDGEKDVIVWDIEDPYKTSKDNFRRIRNLLHKRISKLIENVC